MANIFTTFGFSILHKTKTSILKNKIKTQRRVVNLRSQEMTPQEEVTTKDLSIEMQIRISDTKFTAILHGHRIRNWTHYVKLTLLSGTIF